MIDYLEGLREPKKLRKQVLERDSSLCILCYRCGTDLHLRTSGMGGDKGRYSPERLVTLYGVTRFSPGLAGSDARTESRNNTGREDCRIFKGDIWTNHPVRLSSYCVKLAEEIEAVPYYCRVRNRIQAGTN